MGELCTERHWPYCLDHHRLPRQPRERDPDWMHHALDIYRYVRGIPPLMPEIGGMQLT